MSVTPGDSNDERIIAETRIARAPGWEIRHGIRPTNADHAGIGGLPAVVAAAHPVIRIGKRNTRDAMLAAQFDGALHALMRVKIAGTEIPIPPLQGTKVGNKFRRSLRIYDAAPHRSQKAREAIHAV